MIHTNYQNRADKRIIAKLNGIWEIEPGEMNSPPTKFTHRVEVPSLIDCATPSYDWRTHDFHWYRRTFFAEENQKGRPAFLKIEQSMFGTAVRVNGSLAGESISCYTSQEYRIDGFLKYGSENEILIRVGQRATLPPESAVGKDQERLSFIPGIWGDVKLVHAGRVRVKLAQTLPHVSDSTLDVNIWLENLDNVPKDVVLSGRVSEKLSRRISSETVSMRVTVDPGRETKVSLHVHVTDAKFWSPESPFLYVFNATVKGSDGSFIDEDRVVFGMREFRIEGRDFMLNGRKVFLRGSNIAFHRFLSDGDRRLLPWNKDWIRKALVDIPKEHNFNFFRAHLGHMYNRWYDIADEGGIMLQDEWQFWGATGTKDQIMREFSEWLKDNWNHPSIVIWDALNESSDNLVQNDIIPEMKKLDPTRPWESHDLFEDHPYIYSLGPVLVDRKFGYTRSLEDIRNSNYPSQINEYLWWWLDKDSKPSDLTMKVVSRWLGNDYSEAELVEHQSFLAAELTELFRRLDVRSIQPFVYLSMNEGPTSHWFMGDVAELRPKPVLNALKNAFEPFGVSIELWDRHFFEGENRTATVHIFNDYPDESGGVLEVGVKDLSQKWIKSERIHVHADGSARIEEPVGIILPGEPGDYYIAAELLDTRTGRLSASNKMAHVYRLPSMSEPRNLHKISLIDRTEEVHDFIESTGYSVTRFNGQLDPASDVVLVVGDEIAGDKFREARERLFNWVEEGGKIIFIQPEYGVGKRTEFELPGGLSMIVEPREDRDQGGYDSYVIASDHSHPLWDGIRRIDLRMFNGWYGGEMVPQCDLKLEGEHEVLARSGLNLARPVVIRARAGSGFVVVSSLEIRGRLLAQDGYHDGLYAARPDPVAMRFLLNLLAFCSGTDRDQPSGRGSTSEVVKGKLNA